MTHEQMMKLLDKHEEDNKLYVLKLAINFYATASDSEFIAMLNENICPIMQEIHNLYDDFKVYPKDRMNLFVDHLCFMGILNIDDICDLRPILNEQQLLTLLSAYLKLEYFEHFYSYPQQIQEIYNIIKPKLNTFYDSNKMLKNFLYLFYDLMNEEDVNNLLQIVGAYPISIVADEEMEDIEYILYYYSKELERAIFTAKLIE